VNPSTALASVVVDELVQSDMTEVVLAPGSRNSPLSFALHAADSADRLRLHVRIDERTAGFLALGLAKASERPVAVVTTSGTAAANLHPAVLEAAHSGIPLIVITADRPAELRGAGANQTTDQVKLYGGAVRYFADVPAAEQRGGQVAYWRNVVARSVVAARGVRTDHPGPVHLNLAFREPLVPDADGSWHEPLDAPAGHTAARRVSEVAPLVLDLGPRTVVVAGDASAAEGFKAHSLAESAGWPLLAEPSSQARSGPNAIGPYRLLVASLGQRIERVVVFGHPTLSRPIRRLLGRADVEVVVVSPYGEWPDPGRQARVVVPAVTCYRTDDPTWLRDWLDAGAAATAALDKVLDAEPAMTGLTVARELAQTIPSPSLLYAGSSNPIRDLDLAAAPWLDADVQVLANRGLSGIDGTVSASVGAALAKPGRPAYALVGDLTFLHDANGLLIGRSEPRPDLCIVVVNDDGGGIFGLLEQGAPEHATAFERVFGTSVGADLAAQCAVTSTPHQRVATAEALRSSLAPMPGLRVVEVPVDRVAQRDLHARIAAAVAATA
jgi:2-succinyl-5-enolpyruvyl-6-hydroxy-3-cyclohexene-1-carboxylate synthase